MYLRRWRKFNAEAESIARASSSDDSAPGSISGNSEQANLQLSEGHGDSDASVPLADQSSVSDGDSDLDFGYRSTVESSDSADSSEDEQEQQTLQEKLACWVSKYNHSRLGINELLAILCSVCHTDLPKDVRTLLKTPRTIEVHEKCGRQYSYLGLESGITKVLAAEINFIQNNDNIGLLLNIDGIPLFKSSSQQFWPILCSFSAFKPFLVAIFYGSSKPSSLHDFLQDLLTEIQNIVGNGVFFDGKHFAIHIKAFVCDAPARSFLKCIKSHTGYYACERCIVKGSWKANRIIYNGPDNFQKRGSEDFNAGLYDDHQACITPLVNVGINCIQMFSLDYMHLVCLGIVKRLLCFLKSGPLECRLSNGQIEQISQKLESLSGKLPSEFQRQPRSLKELDRWKATEFRQFLLYTGPIVLRKVVPHHTYEHFLLLSVAMAMLLDSDSEKRNHYLEYARDLLRQFVIKSEDIYTDIFVVYNVHCLVHLADDVQYFETSLNDISAFQFENHLQTLKRLVRNAKNPVAQVVKRYKEANFTGIEKGGEKHCMSTVSTRLRNSCFLLPNENFAFVKEKRDNGRYVCEILKSNQTENFFTVPCESKLLNIVYVRDINLQRRQLLEKEALARKCACLPLSRGFVLMPLLHSQQR